jgi:DNA-binding NarL/FixJ family response regulator
MRKAADGPSAMELVVLAFVASGQMNKQIAYELGLAESTVKAHIVSLMQKLGASCRGELILHAHGVDRAAALASAREMAAQRAGDR